MEEESVARQTTEVQYFSSGVKFWKVWYTLIPIAILEDFDDVVRSQTFVFLIALSLLSILRSTVSYNEQNVTTPAEMLGVYVKFIGSNTRT